MATSDQCGKVLECNSDRQLERWRCIILKPVQELANAFFKLLSTGGAGHHVSIVSIMFTAMHGLLANKSLNSLLKACILYLIEVITHLINKKPLSYWNDQ